MRARSAISRRRFLAASVSYRLGRTLDFDPKTEEVIGDHEANRLLRDADRRLSAPPYDPGAHLSRMFRPLD